MGVMVINTRDTSYSIRGMAINTLSFYQVKGIESLPQTLNLKSLFLWNPMLQILDVSNLHYLI